MRLWASKSLDLWWLPESWATPLYHENKWCWRVDATFGAWVLTVQRRAAQKGIKLPEQELKNADLVRNYLDELGQWSEAERLASAGPIRLQVPDDLVEIVRFGFLPAEVRPPETFLDLKRPDDDPPAAAQIRPPAPSRDMPKAKAKPRTPPSEAPALF